MKKDQRVVITGIGAVMPGSIGKDAAWSACLEGISGIEAIRSFDASSFPVGVAGEVSDDELFALLPEEKVDKVDRFAALAMVAAKEALEDSGLDIPAMSEEVGVYIGSGYSGRKSIDKQNAALYRGGARRVHPRLMQNNITNAASGEVAIYLGLKGPNLAFSVGYASGSYALVQAFNALKLGRMRAVLVGGAEAPVLPLVLQEMMDLGEMSGRRNEPHGISSPFDIRRDGFVASEGACVLVIERLESARSRGVPVYAELRGGSVHYDRHRIHEKGLRTDDMAKTMTGAIMEAGLSPEMVGYICASGLSTRGDDVAETMAIRKVFGTSADRVPVSSVKGVTGYAISASEAFGVASCALAIKNGIIPPTINLENPDEACDLDYVPDKPREADIDLVISNSFGIDGNYSSVVLGAFKE
jgi:3-oxoacyl-[acyl-carrier-protein] synthase II